MPFTLEHREAGEEIEVIVLAGRFVLGEDTEQLERLVSSLLDQGRRKLAIEVSGVTHIDSTGIGRFIASLNRIMAAGGALRLADAGGVVREGFRVTRLDTVFTFCPDIDSAVQQLREQRP